MDRDGQIKLLREILHSVADNIEKPKTRMEIMNMLFPGIEPWFMEKMATNLTPYEGGTDEERERLKVVMEYLVIEAIESRGNEVSLSIQFAFQLGMFWKEKIEKPELIRKKEKKEEVKP